MAEQLTDEAAQKAVAALTGWTLEGGEIRKTFTLSDFRAAIALVNTVADLAEAANHHPDITINYNRVLLVLTSHDAGGLTQKDIDLAGEIERHAATASG
jgi:4a-hydroxytetrahydrobiopterin dehydratase